VFSLEINKHQRGGKNEGVREEISTGSNEKCRGRKMQEWRKWHVPIRFILYVTGEYTPSALALGGLFANPNLVKMLASYEI